MFKKVVKIIGIILGIVFVYLCVEIIPGIFSYDVSSYNSNAYHFRIKNTSDLNIVAHNQRTYTLLEITGDSAKAYMFSIKCDTIDSRLSYNYIEDIDTLCFNSYFDLGEYTLEKEEKPFFSNRITRYYQLEGGYTAKSVTIFSRQYAYVFFQFYDSNSELLDRLLDDFTSSRSYSIKNWIAIWQDRLSGGSKVWSVILMVLSFAIRSVIATVLFFLLFIEAPDYIKEKLKIPSWITIIIAFFVFAFITLTDYFMDWAMGYGSFLGMLLNFLSMFFEE